MTLTQYMQYLKILQDRYGDIDVKVKITYETVGERWFDHSNRYTDAVRPKYDKNDKSIVIYNELVTSGVEKE